MSHKIVFLDRDSLQATVRRPAFAHDWHEYPASAPDQVRERLAGASIAITNKVPLRTADLAGLPALKMIAVAATGTDVIDLDACRARGIVVSNIRDYATTAVPEHCFALLLALRRNLRAYCADVEAGKGQASTRFCLLDHPIQDLAGSQLGIVGYGALGRAVARLGLAFGMRVCVHNRSLVDDPAVLQMELDQLLRRADVVSLHLPLSAQTRHLIGASELALMKPAGFDVLDGEPPAPTNPLLQLRLPNFILTPHVAWASAQAMQALADQLIENIEAFAGASPRNRVA